MQPPKKQDAPDRKKRMAARRIVLAGLISACCAPACAAPLFYECAITQRDTRANWVSSSLGVIFDGSGAVQVIDGTILSHKGSPVPAKARDRGNKIVVRWQLSGLTDRLNTAVPKFVYTATITKATNAVTVLAKPVRFPQRFTGKGTCKTHTDGKLPKILR